MRGVIAILLMVGYYLTTLGVSAALLLVPYLEVTLTRHFHARIAGSSAAWRLHLMPVSPPELAKDPNGSRGPRRCCLPWPSTNLD